MPLAHENAFLVSWMDSVSEPGANKWGPKLTSQFLKSCDLVAANDQVKPDRYENLNLRSELDELCSGTISCDTLEKLVLGVPRLSSFHVLNDVRLLPAVMRLIDRYTQSNSVSILHILISVQSNYSLE
ncbi:hypothetical protein BDV93DRAFT_339648 [Ceratobasidium sp. AG-I]|nr:hypothetical protein BDV93DRAFT_339648 [Ceratobasidium sp. AG-I]